MSDVNDPTTMEAEPCSMYPEGAATGRFLSLAKMREAHGALLQLFREKKKCPEFRHAAAEFLGRGRATGVLLTDDNDRSAAQSLLDYWATTLYRAYDEPAEVTLEEPHPEFEPELGDKLCPYLGPRSFQEDQSKLLFGRAKLIEECLERLEEHRMLVLLGAAGSGRTSVVSGGILPALKNDALSGSKNWRYYGPLTLGESPAQALTDVFAPKSGDLGVTGKPKQLFGFLKRSGGVADLFRKDPDHLAKLIDSQGKEPAVLVIDQFEQIFSLGARDRKAVVDNLARLVHGGKHRLILIVRRDVERRLSALELFKPPLELEKVGAFVPPFTTEELRRAILEPARQIGLKFDPIVVDQLLLDVQGDPAVLPLLQFNLLRLWDHRKRNKITWDAYKKVGGGRQALQDSAEEFYQALSDDEKQAAKRVLLTLVRPTLGPEQFTMQPVARAALERPDGRGLAQRLWNRGRQLFKGGAAPAKATEEPAVIDKLLKARLAYRLSGKTKADERITLVHEALVNYWPELSAWLEEERDTLRTFWLRVKLIVAIAAGVVAIALAVMFYVLWGTADTEFHRADRESGRAKAAEKLAMKEADNAKDEKKNAQLEIASNAVDIGEAQLESGQLARALLWFNRAFRLDSQNGEPVDIHRMRIGAALRQLPRLTQLLYHKDLNQAELSPDNNFVATISENKLTLWKNGANGKAHDLVKDADTNVKDGDKKTTKSLAFNPDGSTLAAAIGGKVRLWDVAGAWPPAERKPALVEKLKHEVSSLSFSPNGRWLVVITSVTGIETSASLVVSTVGLMASPGSNGLVLGAVALIPWRSMESSVAEVWDVVERRRILSERLPGKITCATFSPNNLHLILTTTLPGDRKAETHLWLANPETGNLVWRDRATHKNQVKHAVFSPDSRWLVTVGGRSREVLPSPEEERRLPGEVVLYSISAETKLVRAQLLPAHHDLVIFASFGSDSSHFITTSQDSTAQLWKLTEDPKYPISAHQRALPHNGWVSSAAFSNDGRYVVTGSRDQTARVWFVANGEEVLPPLNHSQTLRKVSFSRDGDEVFTVSDHAARVWQINPENPKDWTLGNGGWLYDHAISADGRLVIEANDEEARVLDLDTAQRVRLHVKHRDRATTFAFGPKGDRLIGVSPARKGKQGAVQVWELRGHKEPRELLRDDSWAGVVSHAAFSGDGRLVAVSGAIAGAESGLVTTGVWHIDKNEKLPLALPANVHGLLLSHIAVSPRGRFVIAAGKNLDVKPKGIAVVWDLTMNKVNVLGHEDQIFCAVFNQAETQLLTTSKDDTFQLWDPASGRMLLSKAPKHTADINWGSFSPAGHHVVTAGYDRKAIVWKLDLDKATATPEATLGHGRPLTHAEFSPDGRLVLTADETGTIRVWDWKTAGLVTVLKHRSRLQSASFDPSGKQVIAVTLAHLRPPAQVRVWDISPSPQSWQALKGYAEVQTAHTINEPTGARARASMEALPPDALDQRKESLRNVPSAAPQRIDRQRAAQSELLQEWFVAAWHLKRVIDSTPPPDDKADLLIRRARNLVRMNTSQSRSAAVQDYESALQDPKQHTDSRLWAELGAAHAALENWDAAAQSYLTGIKHSAKDWRLWAELALNQERAKQSREASASYAMALSLMPRDWDQGMIVKETYGLWQRGMPTEVVLPAFVEGLKNKDAPAARLASVQMMTMVGPPAKDAVNELIKALDDPSPRLRLTAARALGNIGPDAKAAREALARAAKDADAHVQHSAKAALALIDVEGNPAVVLQGMLTPDDPIDRVRKDSYHVLHIYRMKANQTYAIDLRSTDFDTYLRLENAQGNELGKDDDSGGNLNARIVFLAPEDGWYRIIVTSYEPGRFGNYTLTVQPNAPQRAAAD